MNNFSLIRQLGYTLQRIIELLSEDDESGVDSQEITLFPPTNACGDVTDEDSGDDEGVNLDNLPGSLLNAEAQVSAVDAAAVENFDSDEDIPLSQMFPARQSKMNKKKPSMYGSMPWKRTQFDFGRNHYKTDKTLIAKRKKTMMVQELKIFKIYNEKMGGMDRSD